MAPKLTPPSPSAPPAERAPARTRGRPPIISREALLEAARAVFLERGIRATTADVAARAGVSEGTVFHRFKSKDALFREAMQFDPDEVPRFLAAMAGEVGQGDLRTTLVTFATRMIALGRVALPIMMMSWSNPAGEYSLEKMVTRGEGYRCAFRVVHDLFAGEIEAGRLRRDNAEVLARVFLGSLHHFCMSELFLLGEGTFRLSADEFIRGLVDVMLAGGDAKAARPTKARRPNKLSRL